MQKLRSTLYAVLWIAFLSLPACNKDSDDTQQPTFESAGIDIESIDIPAAFKQHVLLHGFSATWCGWCPVLDNTFEKISHDYKGRVSALILHNDDLCVAGDDSVFKFFKITGIPSWFYFPVIPDSTFLSMKQLFGISISSTIDGDSATVKIVTGFRGDLHSPVKLAVYLTEDSITGEQYKQSNSYNTDPTSSLYKKGNPIVNFKHNYVLRKVISSSIFGDIISSSRTVAGVRDVKNYSFLIPPACRKNLKVIAFAYTGTYLYGLVNNVNEVKLGMTKVWD